MAAGEDRTRWHDNARNVHDMGAVMSDRNQYTVTSISELDDVQPTVHLKDGNHGFYTNELTPVNVFGSRPMPHRLREQYERKTRRRLVFKNGDCNISNTNVMKRRQQYLADIFTTLVDVKWRWCILLFILAFVTSWVVFAGIWWAIGYLHDDFVPENVENEDWKPCMAEVHNFATALLFSIETQHTIGYGSRQTTEYCPQAILIMMLQSCCGVIIQAMMTGMVFAKLSRPKKRAQTLMFSKNAVIATRNGKLCLMIRVGDMRKSHIIEAHVRCLMIRKLVTKENEVDPLFQHDVDLGFNDGLDRLFFAWPTIIIHEINEQSPLWNFGKRDLCHERFELILLLEGVVESTGMTTQARTSFLPEEILWGHRFKRLVTYQKENGAYQIDYSRFHDVIAVDTPTCSAYELSLMDDVSEQVDGHGDDMDAVDGVLEVLDRNNANDANQLDRVDSLTTIHTDSEDSMDEGEGNDVVDSLPAPSRLRSMSVPISSIQNRSLKDKLPGQNLAKSLSPKHVSALPTLEEAQQPEQSPDMNLNLSKPTPYMPDVRPHVSEIFKQSVLETDEPSAKPPLGGDSKPSPKVSSKISDPSRFRIIENKSFYDNVDDNTAKTDRRPPAGDGETSVPISYL